MSTNINPIKQIAVTGASGFIGNHLVKFLKGMGFKLRVLINKTDLDLDVEKVFGSLNESSVIRELLKDRLSHTLSQVDRQVHAVKLALLALQCRMSHNSHRPPQKRHRFLVDLFRLVHRRRSKVLLEICTRRNRPPLDP